MSQNDFIFRVLYSLFCTSPFLNYSSLSLRMQFFVFFILDLQEQGHPRQHPLRGLLLRLEVERPHVRGPALPGLVHGAVVQLAQFLLVLRDGSDVHDGHGRVELLQAGLGDGTGADVPSAWNGACDIEEIGIYSVEFNE